MTEDPTHGTDGGPNPHAALLVTRLAWAGMLIGELVVAAVVLVAPLDGGGESNVPMLISGLSVVIMATSIPVGLFLRRRSFQNATEGGVVRPAAYQTGSIIALATCEGPAVIALIAALLHGGLIPYGLPAVIPILVQLWLWPDGRPMFAEADTSSS